MRLVDDSHNYIGILRILLGQLAPQARKFFVLGSSLTNDIPVPAGVIMDIDDAEGTGDQAGLDQCIVFLKSCGVEIASDLVVDQILPRYRQAEGVEAVVFHEVFHLACAILAVVFVQWWNNVFDIARALVYLLAFSFLAGTSRSRGPTSVVQPKSNPPILTPDQA